MRAVKTDETGGQCHAAAPFSVSCHLQYFSVTFLVRGGIKMFLDI